ncbi:MAG: HAD family hydrolase [Saprospirales bacterium]|nr:HAD family hydrolase [Saprospirales bacterium]MBK6904433.1 HAD family hydrolase [Saprospirales bacterium]MBK7337142.1 HAD family hydrolase [Saprospirales bacterium]
MNEIKVIAFDADDTLWVNEPYFQEIEKRFCDMMEDFLPSHSVSRALLETEIGNVGLYGYGVKSFMLSMIETAIKISDGMIGVEAVERIIRLGKEQLDHPIELIDGVEEVLKALQGKYRLVMATKGDLLDQERKLRKSGLEKYFHHIEIVSEKKEPEYQKLIKHLDISPPEFLMIGNSLKSDILPVLNLGGHGFHVPFHTTWEMEKVEIQIEHPNFRELGGIAEVLNYL